MRASFGARSARATVTESFKISPDPSLIEQVRDVVGLHLNPPGNAAVFSFDEKPQVQALARATDLCRWTWQPEGRTDNHGRHGPLDLFAALNVVTGEALARCKARHRAADFVAWAALLAYAAVRNEGQALQVNEDGRRHPRQDAAV